MTPAHDIVEATSQRLEGFLAVRRAELASDPAFSGAGSDPVAALLLDHAARAVSGGKRLRARFAAAAWRAAAGADELPPHVADLGAALEVFQAAALVHDDIIDNSDTRRGRPSAHRALERAHRDAEWAGDGDAFGRSGAILLGDLLLGWSDDLLEAAVRAANAPAARDEYARMRRDVILGQFLDIAEEASWVRTPADSHGERAMRIAALKSARYSVQQPLTIGAALAGAEAGMLDALRAVGLPTGLAFQLRDDVLGVFGDPAETGKPAGDDLREGKRTLLVAYAREAMDPARRERFDAALGDPDLSDDAVRALQEDVRSTGSLDRVERVIEEQVSRATAALEASALPDPARAVLLPLIDQAARRAA